MSESMIERPMHGMLLRPMIETNVDFRAFYALPLVSAMCEDEAMLLFSAMTMKTFAAGEVVYQAGMRSAGEMHLMLDGKVNVTNESGYQYSSRRKGEVFGLFSFLDDSRSHSATISVERDVKVLTLGRACFNMIDIEEPDLGRQLMRFMFQLLSAKTLEMEVEYAHMHHFAFGGKV